MAGTFQGRIAYASIRFSGGVPSIASQSGDFSSTIVDTAAGDITLTLADPIDPDEGIYLASVRGGTPGAVTIAPISDTTIRLNISDFAALADLPCDLAIIVKPLQ